MRGKLALGALMGLSTLMLGQPAGALADPASPADSFVDSIGVNTHTSYTDTAYSQFGSVKSKLTALGVRHVRENLVAGRPDQYQALNDLAASGIKSDLILGDPSSGQAGLNALLSTLKANLLGATDSVEGPNEYDLSGDPNWASALGQYQRQLYAGVKSDPALARLPLIGPSLSRYESGPQLGKLSNALDYGNIHSYFDGYAPETYLTSHFELAADTSGSKPVMTTEAGYPNALNWYGGHQPASEHAAAVYMPRVYMENFRRGAVRTYAYELVDEWPDPNHSIREANFGLLRNDFSEKPAFAAISNLITMLRDPGPSFRPGSLDYALSGDQNRLHRLLLQKRDGTFYLAMWRDDRIWDPVNRVELNVPPKALTLTLRQPVSRVQEFSPNAGTAPTATYTNPTRPLQLSVGPEIKIWRFVPKGGKGKKIQFWTARRSVPAGGSLKVGGRVATGDRKPRVVIQRWARGWRRVGTSRASGRGIFKKRLRLSHRGQTAWLRAVVPHAVRSRKVRVRIRG